MKAVVTAALVGALSGAAVPQLWQSATGFAFQSTAQNCSNRTAQTSANWHTQWLDVNGNTAGGVDCGGDLYVLGNPGPFIQLGMPQEGDVSVAGGYTLAARGDAFTGPGYLAYTVDNTKTIAGVRCTGGLFIFNGVHSQMRYLGCFDLAGNFGVNGTVYAAGYSIGRRGFTIRR